MGTQYGDMGDRKKKAISTTLPTKLPQQLESSGEPWAVTYRYHVVWDQYGTIDSKYFLEAGGSSQKGLAHLLLSFV